GILPAPRGVPQIEVTFDIDANGIVNVSAKDTGSGKEQSIRITASSGLSETDIDRMVKDAEAHAEEDKKKQALIEARNQADSLVYNTEKSLREIGDNIDPVVKADIETKIENVKKLLESDDAEAIKAGADELTQASHKLAEQLYSQKQGEGAGGAAGAGGCAGGTCGGQGGPQGAKPGAKPADDNVVDADYTEVK
ncbi:MAG: molecular chaperone DnaK, partial [Desulfovibrio sp.]|nr:molecular chaperone DnaK [Desulfovibrio sp.]